MTDCVTGCSLEKTFVWIGLNYRTFWAQRRKEIANRRDMAVLHDLFLNSVVGIFDQESELVYRRIATGFYYGHLVGSGQYEVYLVTNNHVVSEFGPDEKIFIVCNQSPDEEPSHFYLDTVSDSGESPWVRHPDRSVDIAVYRVDPSCIESNPNVNCLYSDTCVADIEKIIELGISEGDAVFALGFPLGLSYANQNAVLVRHGVIARIREALDKKLNFYLLDLLSYPGSSGSPIISKPDAHAVAGTKTQNVSQLIGINVGHIPYLEDVVDSREGKVGIVPTNSGIAQVHPCDFITETILEYKQKYD
jgi:S1-C subfamily serine protease